VATLPKNTEENTMKTKFYRYDIDGSTTEYNRTRFTAFLNVNYGKETAAKVLAEFDENHRTKFSYKYGYFSI
jgi:hypothetical protein